jgi:hypothetical protein
MNPSDSSRMIPSVSSRGRVWFTTLLFGGIALAQSTDPAPKPDSTPGHGTAHGADQGKSALPDLPPPKAEYFLSLGQEPQSVRLVLVSAYNGVNYGMNFNGQAKGGARFVIPTGWSVEVAFTNRSPVPHSVVVVERAQVRKLQMGEPYFEGASTTNPVRGTTGIKGETFRFKASEAGAFALACGFPSHAANGHWLALEISDDTPAPSLQLGTGPVFTPTGK